MEDEASAHALLAFSARPRLPRDLLPELARRAARIEDWSALLNTAERHGIAPLLRDHLAAARVAVPIKAERQAAVLFVRDRQANRVRVAVLAEILDAFDAHGIDVRVLKGPALLSTVYGDPALRPFSDLDLLVSPASVFRGQEVLRQIGFRTADSESAASLARHHHLPVATRKTDGVVVHVELHHDALSKDHGLSLLLDETRESPTAIEVGGRAARALGVHEMLLHLCLHLVGPLPRPLRFIWVADVLGFAGACESRLDWSRLAREQPLVLNVLGLAHGLTPLPDEVARHVPAAVVEAMRPVAERPDAWTWVPPRQESGGHRMRRRRSLSPPSWWLSLRYGTRGRSPTWQLRLRHLRTLARVATRRAPSGFAAAGPR